MLSEWLRGHIFTGFPWNVLGYALTMPLELMQLAAVFGIYALTAITVVIFAAPMVAIADAMSGDNENQTSATREASAANMQSVRELFRVAIAIAGLTLIPLISAFSYGTYVLLTNQTGPVDQVRLRLVQPSISQRDKFQASKHAEIFNAHVSLTTPISDKPISHVIWPEAAMPYLARRSPQSLSRIAQALPPGAYLIAGALRLGEPAYDAARQLRVFNSTLVIDTHGAITSFYDKIHLVPFGEYLPFQETLERFGLLHLTRVRGGFQADQMPRRVIKIPGLPAAEILICYEAIFPREVARQSPRPELIINQTNDAWFGTTTGPYQHYHQARVRAVEQAIPVVRSANNGLSAVIDPFGRVLAKLGLNEVGFADADLPAAGAPPPYARFGLWIEVLFIFTLLMRAIYYRK